MRVVGALRPKPPPHRPPAPPPPHRGPVLFQTPELVDLARADVRDFTSPRPLQHLFERDVPRLDASALEFVADRHGRDVSGNGNDPVAKIRIADQRNALLDGPDPA